jgi:hypothetical protein
VRNRVRQLRTLGSVRGEGGAATVNLHGHAAGNGGYGQGQPTAAPVLSYSEASVGVSRTGRRRSGLASDSLIIALAQYLCYSYLLS